VPGEHHLLIFWLQLLLLVAAARGLGSLLRRFGQPAVVGELGAGLLLGPSVLGHFAPEIQRALFPDDPVQQSLLGGLAWLGVFLLLILTGLEIDLGLIRRLRRATSAVAAGSLVVPLFAGIALGYGLPPGFVGEHASRGIFALFLGTALGISALPVVARILLDLDLMRRNFAQVLLASAMANDVFGWILLGVVAGLAQSGSLDGGQLALRLLGLAAFLVLAFTVGQRAVDGLLRRARRSSSGLRAGLTWVLLAALFAGALTHAIGLEAVLGAFVAGVVLGRSRYHDPEVVTQLDGITRTFFAPLFFATAGLRVDLGLLAEPAMLGWGLLVVAVASASKLVGAFAGARVAGLAEREGLALGVGLNARGAVEIVVAAVGLSLGVLNAPSYALVVLMAMATSMMAPPLLRLILRDWVGGEEERARLAQERLVGGNVLLRAGRVLLPTHGGPNSVLAARIVDLAWPEGVEVTVLSAGRDVPAEDVARVRAVFSSRPMSYQHEATREPLAAILEHARLGHDSIALGATDERIAGSLVSPVVDELLAASPLPAVMVRRGGAVDPMAPPGFRRVLVPAVGTRRGRAAQEVAYGVARRLGARVLLAHVVTHPSVAQEVAYARAAGIAGGAPPRAAIAERVVDEASALAAEMGVRVEPVIRTGVSAPEAILGLVREHAVDLVVLTATLRQLTGRPFLGHGVEYLLEQSQTTVVVVTLPPGWAGGSRARG
jgi:Kef-type K+ transport system membrane component KefB/nucleotide-binding universal stress UspA family protein